MKTFLKYTLYLLLLAFVACSSEDDATPTGSNGQAQPGDALELTVSATDFVTDGAPDTRATDSSTTTTFEDDDRVGVIVLDGTGELLYNNIPYEYNSNSNQWMFDSDNDEGKDGCYYDSEARTYIVYYPYSPAADDVCDVDDLKAIYSPKVNQSTKEDYRASDLMLWSDTPNTPQKSLAVDLKHAYASVSISPTAKYLLDDGKDTECFTSSLKISDVNFTINNEVYVPYQATDGSLRCILPAGFTTGDIRCFYTVGSKVYSNKISISLVEANKRYASAPEIINRKYTLDDAKVGDFYCKNSNDEGYLIPSDVALTDDQKQACLGIVMKVGKDNIGDWKDDCQYKLKDNSTSMDIIHGYVLALYNANGGSTCQWGSFGVQNTNTEQYTGFYGYDNTQTIIDNDKNRGPNLQDNFPATYYATAGYDSSHPAPVNSSGWFLPSAGQCWYWFQKKDVILTSMNKIGGNGWSGNYWSSSEADFDPTGTARYINFTYSNVFDFYRNNHLYVRSCLAF